jgi:Protein involved in inorganic phosphate transport
MKKIQVLNAVPITSTVGVTSQSKLCPTLQRKQENTHADFSLQCPHLYDQQKPKRTFFSKGTVANHTPKTTSKHMYIGLIVMATVHMGMGVAHMLYVRTFSFRSALENSKAELGQVSLPVLPFSLSASFHQRSILAFTYMYAYQKEKRASVGTFK